MNNTPDAFRRSLLFVTGTDTGVGKTVLTALLLAHARARGLRALALKPFCTGGRADAELLSVLQDHQLSLNAVNPWWARAPLAPAIALRRMRQKPNKDAVLAHIRAAQERADLLLVEGAGGLMSPLTGETDALDLIAALRCPTVVVAPNRLGCLNHVLMAAELLKSRAGIAPVLVLMAVRQPDPSVAANAPFFAQNRPFSAGFHPSVAGRRGRPSGGGEKK